MTTKKISVFCNEFRLEIRVGHYHGGPLATRTHGGRQRYVFILYLHTILGSDYDVTGKMPNRGCKVVHTAVVCSRTHP